MVQGTRLLRFLNTIRTFRFKTFWVSGQEYPLAGRVERTFAGNPYTEGANPVYFTVTKSQNQRYKLREIYWDDNPENLFSSLYKTTLIKMIIR